MLTLNTGPILEIVVWIVCISHLDDDGKIGSRLWKKRLKIKKMLSFKIIVKDIATLNMFSTLYV